MIKQHLVKLDQTDGPAKHSSQILAAIKSPHQAFPSVLHGSADRPSYTGQRIRHDLDRQERVLRDDARDARVLLLLLDYSQAKS